MDVPKLIKTREYYDRTSGGEDKQSVALELFGRKKADVIEKSPEYLAIVSAASQVEKEKLKQEIEQVKRKQIKSYSTLLDKGEELMNEASTTEEKIAAQRNQRENLKTGVVSEALSWDGEDRNKTDLGDVLEGVIV